MNERFKELLKQSGAYDYYEVNEGVEGDEKPMEKFAELIVKECAAVIEGQDVDPGFKMRMSWAVKKKFGVEE